MRHFEVTEEKNLNHWHIMPFYLMKIEGLITFFFNWLNKQMTLHHWDLLPRSGGIIFRKLCIKLNN